MSTMIATIQDEPILFKHQHRAILIANITGNMFNFNVFGNQE
jgi:hypothetical protein